MRTSLVAFVVSALFCTVAILPRVSQAAVSQEEWNTFLIYFDEKDLVFSPGRSLKPITKTAETMIVITAGQIELMNAHTLADVLSSVVGVQLEFTPSPGIPSPIHIQGSEPRQVRVILDGVTLNNLSDGVADMGSMPVQNIERVEIIKGPASSAWGSSSGGVINIITKSPSTKSHQSISASYGERNTSDLRTELSGTNGAVGYYLSLGRLQSSGFTINMPSELYNAYAKIAMDLKDTNVQLTFSQDKGRRGLGGDLEADINFDNDYLNTVFTLNVTSRISENTTIEAFANHKRAAFNTTVATISDATELDHFNLLDRVTALGTKLTKDIGRNLLVVGIDYSNAKLSANAITGGEQRREEWAAYSNYTLSLERFSITPGIRYDHTSTNGDFVSPQIGGTFSLTPDTLFRALVARGFTTPPLTATFGSTFFFVPNPSLEMEKVLSYQAGVESRALEHFWVRGTLFRHDVSDAITPEALAEGTFTMVNKDKIRRQGVELEVRTEPLYHTSFMAGVTYNDVSDRATGETIPGTARYSLDFGVLYDNTTTKALLRGHYINWNVNELLAAKDGLVIDVNVQRRVFKGNLTKGDVFFAVHNVFGSQQFLESTQRNARRWVEGGFRVTFL